jgi:hypothetical protein
VTDHPEPETVEALLVGFEAVARELEALSAQALRARAGGVDEAPGR